MKDTPLLPLPPVPNPQHLSAPMGKVPCLVASNCSCRWRVAWDMRVPLTHALLPCNDAYPSVADIETAIRAMDRANGQQLDGRTIAIEYVQVGICLRGLAVAFLVCLAPGCSCHAAAVCFRRWGRGLCSHLLHRRTGHFVSQTVV